MKPSPHETLGNLQHFATNYLENADKFYYILCWALGSLTAILSLHLLSVA